MHPVNSTHPAALMALAMSSRAAFVAAERAAFVAAEDAVECVGACGVAEAWRGTGGSRRRGCKPLAGSRGQRRSTLPRIASRIRRIRRISLHRSRFEKPSFPNPGFVISGVSPT